MVDKKVILLELRSSGYEDPRAWETRKPLEIEYVNDI